MFTLKNLARKGLTDKYNLGAYNLVAIGGTTFLVPSHLCQVTVSHIDGLVQERRNSRALAMELRVSCTNPLI